MTETVAHILLVEDDHAHALLIRRAFETRDGSTRLSIASNLREAVHTRDHDHPELIISDLRLPDGLGTDLLGEGPAPPRYPVVIMTSQGDEEIAVEAMRRGALDYVVKSDTSLAALPRTAERALREWGHIVERRQAEEQIRQLNAELEERVRRRTAELEAANKELEAFTYSVSHDLRAPLRAISGFTSIIERNYRENLDDRGQHFMDNILEACSRMDQLLNDLLRYSRLGRQAVTPLSVPLSEVIERVCRTLLPDIKAKNATIEIPASLPCVKGDPIILEQIFTNLLDNALTYTRDGMAPVVAISYTIEGYYITIAVKDNGIGIPELYFDKIFKVFQRLHSSDEYSGTGIGLAIVKKMADLLHGEVSVTSELGAGSTFYVRLPNRPESISP